MNTSSMSCLSRFTSALAVALGFCGTAWLPAQATVVINEFSYDDTGTDDREFVELFNRSGASVDISGWQLRYETAVTTGTLATMPPGTILAPLGRWLVAQPFHTTRNQALLTNLPDSTAALVLRDGATNIVDSVLYEAYAGTWVGAPIEGDPLFPEFLSTDGLDTSWSRLTDGHDTDRNSRDFRIARATPGTSNNQLPIVSYGQNADTVAVGAQVPGWFGSQGAPIVVSASATQISPGVFLPASPQVPAPNDRCIAFQPGTGGRSWWLEEDAVDSAGFDAYVYFDAQTMAPGTRHAWSIGIRSGTGSPYAIPDLPVTTPTTSNGDRGITWTYVSTPSGHTLYLVDHGDGGAGLTVLATIPITTSAWRRLRIGADGMQCEARLDGTVGTTSGTLYRSNVHMGEGNVVVGVGNEGGAAMAMMADVVHVDEPYPNQTANGGSGCQGNCLVKNGDVKTLDDKLAGAAPAGTYAIKIVPQLGGVRFTSVCFFTAQKDKNTTPTATVTLYTDVSGAPGMPIAGDTGPLLRHSTDPTTGTWWAAAIADTRPTAFWVVLTFDAQLKPPLAATETTKNGEILWAPVQVAYSKPSGSNWNPSGTLPWALAFVCPDKAGYMNMSMKTDATPGGTVTVETDGGGDSQFIFGFLGFAPVSFDLTSIGAPGCTLLVDPNGWLAFFGVTSTCGIVDWSVAVPNSPTVIGLQGHFQFAGLDPTLNPFGIATTNRLTVTIQ